MLSEAKHLWSIPLSRRPKGSSEILRFAQNDSFESTPERMKWLCCQLGAREHYAIPRALFRTGVLDCLVTDVWVPPSSLLAKVCGRESKLGERFHSELQDARVKAFNSSLILFEALARPRGLTGWPKIIARNRWFQRKVVNALSSLAVGASAKAADFRSPTSDCPVLLSYSYAALEPFRYAKAKGWKRVLVQIDPGPEEERIVAGEVARVPALAGEWQLAPAEYWASWREECELADRIVVNSEWSLEGLIREGVPPENLSIIPLAYEAPAAGGQPPTQCYGEPGQLEVRCSRSYPAHFTRERPLRVLFLGLINLRKGVARLLEAARILRNEPVEFWMVGPVEIANPEAIERAGPVKWFGSVTRKRAAEFYKNADVFILPTLSDGFAITQLEAQARGLPVIASKNCGNVVEAGVNGTILEQPTAEHISAAIRDYIANPTRLQEFGAASGVREEFSIASVAQRLQELAATL
jgi:glycosyltransferase involved in cell wall biosynthesis